MNEEGGTMAGWSLSKALFRTGVPTLVLGTGKVANELVHKDPGVTVSEILGTNAAGFGILWIAVALAFWIATRLVPSRQKGNS